MKSHINIKVFKCTTILQCETSIYLEGDPLIFRIEVFRNTLTTNSFRFRLTRLDTYRLKPAFHTSKQKERISDERIFVEDNFLWPIDKELKASSEAVAIRTVLKYIKDRLS